MKSTKFFAIAFAAILGITATSCGSGRSAVDREIAALEQQRRLMEAQTELAIAQRQAELRLAEVQQARATLIWTPCRNASLVALGGRTDILTGFGVADQQRSQTDALLNANAVAAVEIASRFIGTIRNGVERYAEQGFTQSGARLDQSAIQSLATSIGERVINELLHPVCGEIAVCDRSGMYIGYVALHVPMGQAVDAAMRELEHERLRFDRERFRNYVNNQLEGQNRQRLAELEAMGN